MLGKHDFRMNQRVCRVEWRDGEPWLRVAEVTRVGPKSIRVDNEPGSSEPWHVTPDKAFEKEYWSQMFDWWRSSYCGMAQARHTLIRLNRLQRLENRMIRRRRKKELRCLKSKS